MTRIFFRIVRICNPGFKCNCLKNENFFLVLFFNFWNLHQILNILKKKMIGIATLFRRTQAVKNLFRPLSEKHRFRTPFDSQHVRRSQTLAKGAMRVRLSYVFIALREPTLECISLSYMSILIGVS